MPALRLPRPAALTAVLLATTLQANSSRAQVQAPGIVSGPALRLAGAQTFAFAPSLAGGAIRWTLDRETISDSGTRTRTNGIESATGPAATLSLSAVSGSETIYYVNASDAGVQDVDTVQVFPADTRSWFTYHSPGNPDVRVYTVVPSTLNPATRILLAMHGNSRTASSYADTWRPWAAAHDYLVLCPFYDVANWPSAGMYQMGNVFSEDDCGGTMNPRERWAFTIDLGIHQQAREGFAIADPRFDMWGFSGGGQHVHRFMLFEPDAPVRLAISAGSGWYTVPDPVIDCPYGPGDPLQFPRQDVLDWTNRDMVIMVGTADTLRDEELRITARADAQGLNRYQRAGYMMSKALAFNRSTHWRRVDVPNSAHESKPMIEGAGSVLLGQVVDTPKTPRPRIRSIVRVHPNPLAGGGRLSGEGWGGSPVQVELFDLSGRRVATHVASASDGRWQLDWRDLVAGTRIAKGVYLVRARDAAGEAEQKIMVLR